MENFTQVWGKSGCIKQSFFIREIDNSCYKHGGQTTDWSPLEQNSYG